MNKPNLTINISEQIEKDKKNEWNVYDYYKEHSVEELQHIADKDRLNYAVCLLNLTGDLNIGSAIRTASVMGAKKVILLGRKKYDKRSTVGAHNYIEVMPVEALNEDYSINITKFWDTLTAENMWPVYVETSGEPLNLFNWENLFKNRRADTTPCLVFGNESYGIPQSLYGVGPTVRIPQRGVLRSLNVASAAAIVIYDLVSRHFMRSQQ